MLKNIIIVNDWASIEGGAANVAINSAIGLAKQYCVYLFSAVQPIDERLGEVGVKVICIGKKDILHDENRFHVQYSRVYGIMKQRRSLHIFWLH